VIDCRQRLLPAEGDIVKILCLFSALTLTGIAGHALADGDPVKGEAVFHSCRSCHSTDEGANRVGPSLFHVVGRPAASAPNYTYSDAMKAFGAAGHKWDEATLTAYLQAPRDYIPGVNMKFAGLKKPEDIANVISYLKNPKAVKSGWW
jgi:cytochrome c